MPPYIHPVHINSSFVFRFFFHVKLNFVMEMFISFVNRLKVIYKGINKIVETFGNGVSLLFIRLYCTVQLFGNT